MTASEARVDARAWRARAESHYFPPGIQGNEWQDEAAMYLRAAVALDAFADGIDAAAREREACAKVADDYAVKHDGDRCSGGDMGRGHDGDAYRGAEDVAALIRARGAK